MVKKGKGWHGEEKRHRDAANKGALNDALRAAPKKSNEYFSIEEDRMGNITLSHSKEVGDVFFQFEADKEAIYDLLRPSEREELNDGYSVDIPDDQARASVLQELFEISDSQRAENLGIDTEILRLAEKEIGTKLEKVEDYGQGGLGTFIFDDGSEYLTFEALDDAERAAVNQVKEDLNENPEMFTPDWLRDYISMSETDRNITSGEEADDYVDNQMGEDELIREAGLKEAWDELDVEKIELEEQRELFSTTDFDEKMDNIQEKMDTIAEKAKEDVRSSKREEIYDALEDPVQYFVEDHGMYTLEQLMKSNIVHIDIKEAAQGAVDTDGIAHFLATYDGNQIDLDNGAVMFRTG